MDLWLERFTYGTTSWELYKNDLWSCKKGWAFIHLLQCGPPPVCNAQKNNLAYAFIYTKVFRSIIKPLFYIITFGIVFNTTAKKPDFTKSLWDLGLPESKDIVLNYTTKWTVSERGPEESPYLNPRLLVERTHWLSACEWFRSRACPPRSVLIWNQNFFQPKPEHFSDLEKVLTARPISSGKTQERVKL